MKRLGGATSPPVKSHPHPIRLGFVKQHLDVTFGDVAGLDRASQPSFLCFRAFVIVIGRWILSVHLPTEELPKDLVRLSPLNLAQTHFIIISPPPFLCTFLSYIFVDLAPIG